MTRGWSPPVYIGVHGRLSLYCYLPTYNNPISFYYFACMCKLLLAANILKFSCSGLYNAIETHLPTHQLENLSAIPIQTDWETHSVRNCLVSWNGDTTTRSLMSYRSSGVSGLLQPRDWLRLVVEVADNDNPHDSKRRTGQCCQLI